MSAKPKALLKQSKAKKKQQRALNDADDYLAAAVDDEDAMGKHRGGDGPKALRFAHRALELYDQGLSKFPRDFDLAYNKARLELEIATHPTLAKHLDVQAIDVLRKALGSHRYALILDPQNADLLFNTAQVLTAIAENIAKDDSLPNSEALSCLENALEYQEQCLVRQQERYAESRRMEEEAGQSLQDNDDGGAKLDANMSTAYEEREEEQQWVSVVEPVTAATLIDTMTAQLSTLTTLCSVLNSSLSGGDTGAPSVSWIEGYAQKVVDGVLPEVLKSAEELSDRLAELALAKAIFAGNLLELAYRSAAINADAYKQNLDTAFSASDLTETAESNLAYARALISLNSAITETIMVGSDDATAHSNLRWNALSKAQKLLAAAAGGASQDENPDPELVATTHILRGDTSLLLLSLSYHPFCFPQAVANAAQLLKNGEVFYRNATKLFGSLGESGQDEQAIAMLRGTVVTAMQRPGAAVVDNTGKAAAVQAETLATAVPGRSSYWIDEQVQDMIAEGLVPAATFGLH